MASESPLRPLAATGLLALALIALPLARTPEAGVTVTRASLRSPAGHDVPVLLVAPRGPARGTALLAHGITASKETLRAHAEGLALAGLSCVVVDLPAHGESSTALTFENVEDALAAGALSLDPGRRVDVLLGHSFGAYNGARAVATGAVRARLFVALGARPALGSTSPRAGRPGDGGRPERALFVSGGLEELHGADAVRRHAAAQGGEAVIVPGVNHALEPFDPRVIAAVVDGAVDVLGLDPPRRPQAWRARFTGLLTLVACALCAVPLLPRGGGGVGFLAGLLLVAAVVSALHGISLYLAPTPGRLLVAGLLTGLAGAASVGLFALVRRIREDAGPGTGHGIAVGLACLACAGAALADRWFVFLILLLLSVLVVLATAFAAWAGRGRSPGAAHGAFAVVLGYVPGAWFGSLLT